MTPKEHARRRKRLTEIMGEGAIAILPSAPVRSRNRDIDYPYRPDSDFFYLTGCAEPEAAAVIAPGRKQGEFLLFCRERDSEAEQWNGARMGLEGACGTLGADDAFPIGDINDILPGLLEGRDRVFYAMGCYPDFDQQVMGWINRLRMRGRAGVQTPGEIVALDHVLHDLRLLKSHLEIKAMRRAAAISAAAHRRAMAVCRPGMTEFQIEAELTYEFMTGGARSAAYPSIVAAGANACILHYTENAGKLKNGELLLIDAGAEFEYYAADITRTYPINGTFTRWQRALYDIVLEAQAAAIEQVRPGNHWNAPHEAAVKVITEGLHAVGVFKGRVETSIKKEKYKPYYMHRTGHWLGMDVHDVGDYKVAGEWRELEPGMALTIEPGIYTGGAARVAPKWRNIGIRIEDDVVVTANGCEVLTDAVPKAVDDLQAMVGGGCWQ